MFGKAGLIGGFFQLIIAGLYPAILRCGIRPGHVLGAGFAVCSTCIFLLSHTTVPRLGQLVVVMIGLPSALLYTIPVGLTVSKSDESNRGRYLGALNCFAVIPQLIDTSYTGFVSRHFGEAAVMLIAATWGLAAGLFAAMVMGSG